MTSSPKRSNKRISHLQKKLHEWGCDAAIVENPVDLFYLTGVKVSLGSLLLDKKNAVLMVDGRYIEMAEEQSSVPVSLMSSEDLYNFFKKKKVAFDSNTTSYAHYQKIKTNIPLMQAVPNMLKELRAIKDNEELKKIRKSCKLLLKGYDYLLTQLQPGISEKDLATAFEFYCRKHGAQGLAFDSIIAFGENSAMPHHHSGDRTLKKGDLVLCDIGLIVDDYRSDMTRVHFFGPPLPVLKKLEEVVKRAQAAALRLCKPGVFVSELDKAARRVMAKAKKEQLFVHSLGHGIGLETHEYPRIRAIGEDKDVILEPGMVITIEPGLYMPGKGGIRIEDMVVITPKGHEKLF